MVKFDLTSTIIGSFGGALFSVILYLFLNFSGFGIFSSNIIAGFYHSVY